MPRTNSLGRGVGLCAFNCCSKRPCIQGKQKKYLPDTTTRAKRLRTRQRLIMHATAAAAIVAATAAIVATAAEPSPPPPSPPPPSPLLRRRAHRL